MSEPYTDIRILIGRQSEDGSYPLRAELDDGSVFDGGALRLQMEELLAAVLDPKEYGLDLFDALFSGPIRRAYDKVSGRAEAETQGRVRVRLWIDDGAAELNAVPWERIYHIHRGREVALAASVLTPFSRYTGLELREGEMVTERPVRLLFAISNPSDLPPNLAPIDVEREVRDLHKALGNLQQAGQVEITILPGRTGLSPELHARLERDDYRIKPGATTLTTVLEQLSDCHIFHFLGHGHFERRDSQGEGVTHLHLEQADGTWVATADGVVVDGVARMERPPHLVFLAACESAKRETEAENAFVGLGPKLVKVGVPAVVAMQDLLPMEMAGDLTDRFYSELLEHGVVDRALNAARHALFDAERIAWAIPVLFMRLRAGELFAPDPVRTALQAILERYETDRPPLSVEVTRMVGLQETVQLGQIGQGSMPSLDLVQAVQNIFDEAQQAPSQG
ncbi:MAG TPA: CHAT domain-containing protein, partial [Anaerolineae bacterium]|nr:CHAT domain-containing protein [Anaerolineae bacterium]